MESLFHIHIKKEQHLKCAEIFSTNSDIELDRKVQRTDIRNYAAKKPGSFLNTAKELESSESQHPVPRPTRVGAEFEIDKSDIQIFVPPSIDEKILSTARERLKNMITHHKASVCNQRFHKKIGY